MAGEEKVVLGGDGEGVAHEGSGVDGQGTGHLARDAGRALAGCSRIWQDVQVNRGDGVCFAGDFKRDWARSTYISGSFWVSITAAMGMPKLEAGPQKSVR